jgi:hypothetical protein
MNNAPEVYYNISQTQMSIARHYGGLKVNGVEYRYDAETDRLVREDIAKRDEQRKAAEQRKMVAQMREMHRMGQQLERAKQEFMF